MSYKLCFGKIWGLWVKSTSWTNWIMKWIIQRLPLQPRHGRCSCRFEPREQLVAHTHTHIHTRKKPQACMSTRVTSVYTGTLLCSLPVTVKLWSVLLDSAHIVLLCLCTCLLSQACSGAGLAHTSRADIKTQGCFSTRQDSLCQFFNMRIWVKCFEKVFASEKNNQIINC